MQNQQFKTIDLVTLLAMLSIAVIVIVQVVKQSQSNNPKNQAMRMAENISAQLLNLDRKKFNDTGLVATKEGRSPASQGGAARPAKLGPEGKIGEDPWGNPFHYRFVESPEGKWSYLVVWSQGPDQRPAKKLSEWSHEVLSQKMAVHQQKYLQDGDDFGLVFPIKD